MKVIKTPETWQSKQVTCDCGAVLEVEFSDLRRTHYDGDPRDQREQAWDKVYVTCPVSNHEIRIKDVPEWMISRIPSSGYSR